jgi:hypothetical protein
MMNEETEVFSQLPGPGFYRRIRFRFHRRSERKRAKNSGQGHDQTKIPINRGQAGRKRRRQESGAQ